jgi:hypothetical protein
LEEDIDLLIHQCHTEREEREDCNNLPAFNLSPLELRIQQRTVSKATPNLEALRPNFGWLPIERIKKTIQATTQFARTLPRYPFHKHYRTRWPAANVDRWNKDVATDTFFSDTPAHDDGIFGHSGCTMAQIYIGKRSSKTVAYGMKSESQMPNTLEDLIRKHGAPNCLFSDNAKVQIGKRVHDILRLYFSVSMPSRIFNASPNISTNILPRERLAMLSASPVELWIALALLLASGSSVFSM